MLHDEDEIRAHIESLSEELAQIPRHSGNAVKVADRERELRFYKDQLARRQAVRQSFLARRHELLARCRVFGGKH